MPPSYHPNVLVARDGHVATVTIDRPGSRNGFTGDMFVALGRTFAELGQSGARCIVLTGAGGNFSTGADLGGPQEGDPPATGRPGATNLDAMRVIAEVVLAIHECPVPVVAKVEGLCVGAGFGLALAADLTWCADDARLSTIFAKRGLSLDFGTSWFLRERLGVHKAKELAFTATVLSGTEAFELGLVNAAVPADRLDAAVAEVVQVIADGPPIALSMTKRQLDAASGSSLAAALEQEGLAQTVNVGTEDLREALAAFVERRPAKFVGR